MHGNSNTKYFEILKYYSVLKIVTSCLLVCSCSSVFVSFPEPDDSVSSRTARVSLRQNKANNRQYIAGLYWRLLALVCLKETRAVLEDTLSFVSGNDTKTEQHEQTNKQEVTILRTE